MKEIFEKVQTFCNDYGFYFAIAAAALLLIWLITWIALGVKCRKLKKKNKALYTANAEYIRADEQRATEAARAAVAEAPAVEPTPEPIAPAPAAKPEPSEDERLAALLAEMDEEEPPAAAEETETAPAPAPADDAFDEEFDITAAEDDAAEAKEEKAVKEIAVNYVVKYDRAKLSWIITKKGSQRVVRRVQTKEEALRVARDLCKRTGAGLYVHKKDGKFQKI